MQKHRTSWLMTLCIYWLLSFPVWSAVSGSFSINASTDFSTDGSVRLFWQLPANTLIELQKRVPEKNDFFTIYQGQDGATVITGLVDGNYEFRARLKNHEGDFSDWSSTLKLLVEHHSLTRAMTYFFVGAGVFIGTVMLILIGIRQVRSEGGRFE